MQFALRSLTCALWESHGWSVSARGSGRIPDDRFHASFGEGYRFVINQPVIVGGYSRFQYRGYWFGFVRPWP